MITPPHAVGPVDVVVTYQGQSGMLMSGFAYGLAAPVTISRISTSVGPTAGGTHLSVGGAGFPVGTRVTLDGVEVRVLYYSSSEIHLMTRPHAAGTVELAVLAPDGQIDRLAGGFTFARPSVSDFNGVWEGYVGDEGETAFSFTVENDALVSLTCYTTTIAFSPPPSTRSGEFAVVDRRGAMTGGLLKADYAEGTISLAGCTTYDSGWFATRR